MLTKKEPSSPPNRDLRKELEYLQARKSAIEALIQSMEDYDRFRPMPTSAPKRETA